jgi:hypothetical protein
MGTSADWARAKGKARLLENPQWIEADRKRRAVEKEQADRKRRSSEREWRIWDGSRGHGRMTKTK